MEDRLKIGLPKLELPEGLTAEGLLHETRVASKGFGAEGA